MLTAGNPGTGGRDAPLVLVEILANRWPGLRAVLIAEHIPDDNGLCRGCRLPGYGTPAEHWPCLLATVALEAARLVKARRGW